MTDDANEVCSTQSDASNPPFPCSDPECGRMLSQAASRADMFISAKTSTPIPAPHSIVRCALVQAALDPLVRSLDFIASATIEAKPVTLKAIVVIRDDGRFYLDIIETRPVRDVETEGLVLIALDRLGLAPLTLTAAEIRREPRFANARAVWEHRMHPVGLSMRLKVLTLLQDDGPLPLGLLLSRIRATRDPAPVVMAMACSDLIELDLVSRPLGPSTIVRSRS